MQVIPLDHPTGEYEQPLDLEGYWWEGIDIVCVPWIAGKPRPFLRFLSKIEAIGKPVFFPTVVNARLDRLLRLRGYVDAVTDKPDPNFRCPVTGLVRFPS